MPKFYFSKLNITWDISYFAWRISALDNFSFAMQNMWSKIDFTFQYDSPTKQRNKMVSFQTFSLSKEKKIPSWCEQKKLLLTFCSSLEFLNLYKKTWFKQKKCVCYKQTKKPSRTLCFSLKIQWLLQLCDLRAMMSGVYP